MKTRQQKFRSLLFDDEAAGERSSDENSLGPEDDELLSCNDDDDLDENDSFISDHDDVEAASTSESEDSDYSVKLSKRAPSCSVAAATATGTPPTQAAEASGSGTKKRGRPRIHPLLPEDKQSSRKNRATSQHEDKPPGHPTLPVNSFSLTITKTGGDVELYILDKLYDFLLEYTIKGGVSTEVGHKVHNLHFQGIFTIRFPKDRAHIATLVKMIKALIKPLSGYKVLLKPFAPQQTFSAMIGYITKDQGSHFLFVLLIRICFVKCCCFSS